MESTLFSVDKAECGRGHGCKMQGNDFPARFPSHWPFCSASAGDSPLLPNQLQQLPRRHLAAHLAAFQEIVGKVALVSMEFDDLFLDGVLGDEAIDGNGALLADAVGAVGGLVLHGGVPPGVHVDDVVGGGEVDAEAAGFQADEEYIAFTCLEGVHPALAFFGGGGSVQVLVGNAGFVQCRPDDGEVVHELAEDEGLVAIFQMNFCTW